MKDKVKIQRGTVQETLVFPVYGRCVATEKYPQLFRDTEAKKIMEKIDYDWSLANMGSIPNIVYGMRHETLVSAAQEYLKEFPDAIIVNLGCGLDTSFPFIDNGSCRYVNLDFPDVIELREKLFALREREMNLAHDALDFLWMEKIGAGDKDHVYVISGGVLFYFKPEMVRTLVDTLARRFPGGGFIYDFENKSMAAISNRKVRKSGNKGAEMYYWLDDAGKEISAYSEHIESVTIINSIPKEYSVLPFIPRLVLKFEFGKEFMGFAKIRFK